LEIAPSKTIPHGSPDWFALAGIAITIAAHSILTATTKKSNPVFIVGACVFWIGFVFIRARQNKNAFRDWGFRADNLRQAVTIPAMLLGVLAGSFAGYAHFQGTLLFPLHTLLLFLFYPIWGLIQQFLALSIVVNNLERIPTLGRKKPLLVMVSAILFGMVHAYDIRLAAGTLFLELLIIPLYLKDRNLWPLGVLHGWIGVLFYLWVLNQDLWIETFGS
jgi:uncharacterized protein